MPESSLSGQLSDLWQAIGLYQGFAGNYPFTASGSIAQTQADYAVKTGYRQFLFPKLDSQAAVAHVWSFLKQERTLSVIANQGVYDLPDDFGGLDTEMTYQPTDSTEVTVKEIGIGEVQRLLQMTYGSTGKPTNCAAFPKPSDGVSGQRWGISLVLIPDQNYTLTYRMNVLPQALSPTNPFPLGGMTHFDTLKASCLAVCEMEFQDEPDGPRKASFLERLQASISQDVRDFKPEYLGVNGDRSDGIRYDMSPWGPWVGNYEISGVLYNGQPYT